LRYSTKNGSCPSGVNIPCFAARAARWRAVGRLVTRACFVPVAVVPGAAPATAREARDGAMIKVGLRNGRTPADVEPGMRRAWGGGLEASR
jgi:hypothetical protein